MMIKHVSPVFVEFIPDQIEEGNLYISEQYNTVIHKCCCGCGEEVVTPLSPVDWRLVKGARGISLYPSIGNWSYQCKSHYFIRDNQILWAEQMSPQQIRRVQQKDFQDKERHIAYLNSNRDDALKQPAQKHVDVPSFIGLIRTVWRFVKSKFVRRR
ncbi:DUF6527 family protein [Pseudomonas farris]